MDLNEIKSNESNSRNTDTIIVALVIVTRGKCYGPSGRPQLDSIRLTIPSLQPSSCMNQIATTKILVCENENKLHVHNK